MVFLFDSSLFPFLPLKMAKISCFCLAKSQKRRQKTRPPPNLWPLATRLGDSSLTGGVTGQKDWCLCAYFLFLSGVAPANQTKERAKTKSSWISPIFVNSGVFPWENKRDSHWTFVPECPCEKFMNWPFFGLVCRGDSWWKRLKGKNPEGKNFRKLLRRKQSSAKISKISRNTLKSSKSDIFYLLRNLLRTFFSSAKFSEVFALYVFSLWLFSDFFPALFVLRGIFGGSLTATAEIEILGGKRSSTTNNHSRLLTPPSRDKVSGRQASPFLFVARRVSRADTYLPDPSSQIRPPCTRVKNPKIRKRGFRSRKNPHFPPTPPHPTPERASRVKK